MCKKKPNCSFRDFNDVTFDSSAIFFNWGFALNQGQQEILKTRGFPSPDYAGFGFSDVKIKQGIWGSFALILICIIEHWILFDSNRHYNYTSVVLIVNIDILRKGLHKKNPFPLSDRKLEVPTKKNPWDFPEFLFY